MIGCFGRFFVSPCWPIRDFVRVNRGFAEFRDFGEVPALGVGVDPPVFYIMVWRVFDSIWRLLFFFCGVEVDQGRERVQGK